jgi:hypothetical protein
MQRESTAKPVAHWANQAGEKYVFVPVNWDKEKHPAKHWFYEALLTEAEDTRFELAAPCGVPQFQ